MVLGHKDHDKPKPPKPQATTTTTPFPVVSPPPTPMVPPAPPGQSLGSFGNATIDQWDAAFVRAAQAVQQKKDISVDPRVMKAMMDVESGGNGNYPASKCRSDGSCGPMQIKPQYHQWRCPECDFSKVSGQIELATHIIGDAMKALDTDEYGAITSVYFPTDDILNGTTQAQYVAHVKDLVSKMGGTTPAPAQPEGDVLDLIFGGKPYDISAYYGQLVTWSCPGCYDYFTAYGLDSQHHWAYDVTARAGDGAPLYAPFDGKIVCAGTANGPGAWGTGCLAFARNNNYGGKPSGVGSGRLEILHADGDRSLILGHALSSRVRPGDLVKRGDVIGQEGGMNGSHVHVEGRLANGTQIGDPRKLFGGGPIPVERLPYNFDLSAHPNLFNVRAKKKMAVYQRADPTAALLDSLAAGEEFQAVAIVPGNDGKDWYLGIYNGRVPVEGTERVT